MTPSTTLPRREDRTIRVEAVRASVVSGPDRGRSATGERVAVGSSPGNELELTDATVSRFHVDLVAGDGGIHVRDHGSTNGCFAGRIRIRDAVVPPGSQLRLGDSVVEVTDGAALDVEIAPPDVIPGLIGASAPVRRLGAQIRRAAAATASVLLLGESGTGKEVVARALHRLGPRAAGPFEVVDCSTLSANLLASELFGHEKGSFTGADRQHAGAFERAHGGTLFLDEIGEMAPTLQAQLLGALERRRFRRVGGKTEIEVDVRVVAATHRDLRTAVNEGRFRIDLYHRIAVVTLTLPALRERTEDLAILIEHFLRANGVTAPIEAYFPPDRIEELARHAWPGNVRELRNVVEATLATGQPPVLSTAPNATDDQDRGSDLIDRVLSATYKDARATVLGEFERRYLTHLLEGTKRNVAAAARAAKMDRSHLIDLLHRHRLNDD